MPDTLFVYGSLRSEFDNPQVRMLKKQADSLGEAKVRGSIFLVGQFSAFQHEPAGIVRGELWRLHDPEVTLKALDEYEGAEYPRVVIPVLEGPASEAWIYIYPGPVRPDQQIVSGDFLAR